MNFISYAWQDLGKNRVRTLFAVSGILISVFLLTSVSILNDSLSYSYVDLATTQAGSSDLVFTKTIEADVNFDPFFGQSIIEERLGDTPDIHNFYPRLLMPVEVDRWDKPGTTETILFYGIDLLLETTGGDMGDLWELDEDGQRVAKFESSIPAGHCIVLARTAKVLNVSVGDSINVTYTKYKQSFEIDAVVEQDLKFSLVETNLIITDLSVAQQFMGVGQKVNNVMATLAHPERVYDSRDYDGTTTRLRRIGQKIQEKIGFDYTVTMPKLVELEVSEYIMTGMSTMFWFITLLSMLITGILINGILSTSVEERIREFGIFRTLGCRKIFNLRLILVEGFIMSALGTALGVLMSIGAVPWILPVIFDYFNLWSQPIPFIILPESVVLSFVLGISISLGVSAFPALKTSRIKITEAIQPFRHGSSDYKIRKEGSANTKAIVVGVSIAIVGALIFVVFPRVFMSQDMTLILSMFVILLFSVLLGLVFASVAVIPVIEKGLSYLFKPFIGKFLPIVQTSLKRYRRRNSSTVVMFAISFAFIFFVTTRLEIEKQNNATLFEFQYGADVVLVNRGQPGSGTAITQALADELAQHPDVSGAATTLYNVFDVQSLFAMFGGDMFGGDETGGQLSSLAEETSGGQSSPEELIGDEIADSGGGGGGGGGMMGGGSMQTMEGNDFSIMGLFGGGGIEKYRVEVSDLAGINDVTGGLVGVDERYVEISNHDYFMWAEGDESAFDQIFSRNDTCIIAKAMADVLMKGVGDQVRLRIFDENGMELNQTDQVFTIVAVSGGMPGYWNFRSSEWSAWYGGVMVSLDTYASLMDWWPKDQLALPAEDRDETKLEVDKIFIKLDDRSTQKVQEFKAYLADAYGNEYSYLVDDAISYITQSTETTNTVSTIMEVILTFTILISLFGLLSSMYATILERTLEIGIVRAIGMKVHEVRRMFLAESMCIMLASGLMGMGIGSTIAYLLASQTSLLTEVPVLFVPPWDTIIRVFLLSIGLGTAGMFGILRGLSKMTIMDIFRQTF